MRKLFLHVGFAKCGSTSLQAALANATGILCPKSGNHGGEHLALALELRGVDNWTRKFFDETWVAAGMAGIWEEIAASDLPVVLSSERLAAMTVPEIERAVEMFRDFDVEIILIRRDIQRYLSSTWRHAVYRHDFGDSYEAFLERFKNFSFGDAKSKFAPYFPVHTFDMEDADYVPSLEALIGTKLELPKSNVGVPFEFASLLQKTHALMGSKAFKQRFDAPTKQKMLQVWSGNASVEIEPMQAPLF